MKKFTVQHLATAAAVGAVYAVLSIFGSVFGVTFGTVQCRFAEALCVLPFFFPETVWGLFVGCLITNLLSPYGLLDIVMGSLTTGGVQWDPGGRDAGLGAGGLYRRLRRDLRPQRRLRGPGRADRLLRPGLPAAVAPAENTVFQKSHETKSIRPVCADEEIK